MTHYFVDNRTQPDGAHEVHSVGCKRMASDKQYLGDFLSCEQAVVEARKAFWQTASCVRCMTERMPERVTEETGRHREFRLDLKGLRPAGI